MDKSEPNNGSDAVLDRLDGDEPLTTKETSRRARAAWAYAAIDQKELAARTGIGHDRITRILSRNPLVQATDDELRKIAEVCEFSQALMLVGPKRCDVMIEESQNTDILAEQLESLQDEVRAGFAELKYLLFEGQQEGQPSAEFPSREIVDLHQRLADLRLEHVARERKSPRQ
jgi:transcriptional regulator with XRE-family HTH domain